MEPHETALEFLTKISRCIPVPELSFLKPQCQIRAGEVITLCGRPGSGKTAIAMHCAIQSVLPKEHGGAELFTAWLNTNGDLDVGCIHAQLLKMVGESQAELKVVEECMARLLVFDCSTPIQLFLASRKLHEIAEKERKLGCIIIDSVSTHWHLDKSLTLQKKAASLAFQLIMDIRKRFQMAVIATRPSFSRRCTDWFTSDAYGRDIRVEFPMYDAPGGGQGGLVYPIFDSKVTHRVCLCAYSVSPGFTRIATRMPSAVLGGNLSHSHLSISEHRTVVGQEGNLF